MFIFRVNTIFLKDGLKKCPHKYPFQMWILWVAGVIPYSRNNNLENMKKEDNRKYKKRCALKINDI
jgi:hypothetical protein